MAPGLVAAGAAAGLLGGYVAVAERSSVKAQPVTDQREVRARESDDGIDAVEQRGAGVVRGDPVLVDVQEQQQARAGSLSVRLGSFVP